MTITPCEVEALAVIDSAIEECIGQTIQFYNLSTQGDNFTWDFGVENITTDTSQKLNPTYTLPDTGLYTIRLIATGAQGCKDTSYLSYRVLPQIIPDFDGPLDVCFDNHSLDYVAGGIARPTTQMHWIFDQDTIYPIGESKGIYGYEFDQPSMHTATLVYEDFGCYKDSTKFVRLQQNPELRLNEPSVSECPPLTAPFSVSTKYALNPTFSWFLSDSLVSTDSIYVFQSNVPATYDLSVQLITDSVCIDTVSVNFLNHIEVLELPTAAMSFNHDSKDMWEPHFEIYDEKQNAIKHTFYLDSSKLSSLGYIELSLNDTGNYTITQIAEHANGCLDTISDTLRVIPEFLVYIPNAFSPNGDGLNDIWYPSVFVWKTYNLRIFDRWGEEIFQSNDPNEGWNGEAHRGGVLSPIGSYSYLINIEGPDSRQWQYSGQVSIVQ